MLITHNTAQARIIVVRNYIIILRNRLFESNVITDITSLARSKLPTPNNIHTKIINYIILTHYIRYNIVVLSANAKYCYNAVH